MTETFNVHPPEGIITVTIADGYVYFQPTRNAERSAYRSGSKRNRPLRVTESLQAWIDHCHTHNYKIVGSTPAWTHFVAQIKAKPNPTTRGVGNAYRALLIRLNYPRADIERFCPQYELSWMGETFRI